MKASSIILLLIIFSSCSPKTETTEAPKPVLNSINWSNRAVDISGIDSLVSGKSYLSVNSSIYSSTQNLVRNLTVTVSLRNTDEQDTVYMDRVDLFDTDGQLIKSYAKSPIFIKPMETIEIVINQLDKSGGTGGNFIFEWKTPEGANEPLFESVMLSVLGNNAFAYGMQGKRIK